MATTVAPTHSLEHAAQDGSVEIADWPKLLEDLLQRLHNIVHNDFPIPQIPTPEGLMSISANDIVKSTPPEPQPTQTTALSQDKPDDVKDGHIATSSTPIPPELLSSYQSSVRILERDFSAAPPYTVQRLAELVLQPRKHYRYLPAYLRALDRVVSVSSPTSDFPLPTGVANNSNFLTNGDIDDLNGIQEREGLGSDESLGGALLTPIPWLRNSNAMAQDGEFHSERMDTIIGPNGAGSVETVSVTMSGIPSAAHTSPNTSTPASPTLSEQSDASTNSSGSISTEAQLREQGGVTQGELLRQEQEAGLVPIAQAVGGRRIPVTTDYAAAGRAPAPMTTETDAEVPHARGPDTIGMEDTGMVQGNATIDIEGAVGRGRSKSPQPPPADKDTDGDVVVND